MMCWGSAPNPAEDAALGTRKGAHPFEPICGGILFDRAGASALAFCFGGRL